MATVSQRMDKHTNKDNLDGCWIWTAHATLQGYGQIRVDGKTLKAHRVAWSLVNGQIPDSMMVLHHCDNPSCVNPAHLHLGTLADNNRERCERGRSFIPLGETNAASKLIEPQVLEIRECYANGGITQRELAKRYGVCKSLISAIVNRRNWIHI